MLMKFIEWLNGKTGLVKKSNYKFECGYIWASMIFHLFLLAVICSFLFIIGFMFFIFVESHLEYINPVLSNDLETWLGLSPETVYLPWGILLIMDCCFLFLVYLGFKAQFDKCLDAVLTRLCKQIPKE